mgnify:FL=1
MKTIYLKGTIGLDITAEKLKSMVNLNSTEKLQILINSTGGSIFEAFELFDILKNYKGQKEFVLLPLAASAASYWTMAGDKISAFKNSIWMAHKIQTIAIGDADEMQLQADIMRALENIMVEAYQKRLPGTKEEILNKLKNEVWMVGWEQLAENGIIDNVIDSVDEIYIEEENKDDIVRSLEEVTTENAKQLVAMRIKKIESQMRANEIDYRDEYKKIAAKIDVDAILNKGEKYFNPYPNEHSARIRDPEEFEENSFRRKALEGEKGIDIIIGKLKGEKNTTAQSYRFKIENWTADEAKKWLKDHNIKYKVFEPASGNKESQAGETANDKFNNTGETKMTLQEFLKDNPEAKAEYEAALEAANAKGKSESNVIAERMRIYNILDLAGVQMTKEVGEAIQNDLSDADFAREELLRQKEMRAKNTGVDFGNLAKKQMPGEQDPEGKKKFEGDVAKSLEEYDKQSEAIGKKHFAGVV